MFIISTRLLGYIIHKKLPLAIVNIITSAKSIKFVVIIVLYLFLSRKKKPGLDRASLFEENAGLGMLFLSADMSVQHHKFMGCLHFRGP